MASETLCLLLNVFQQSRDTGESATLPLETKNGEEHVTFKYFKAAGIPAVNPRGRRKTPSQLKRDKRRAEPYHLDKNASVEAGEAVVANDTEVDAVLKDIKAETLTKKHYDIEGGYSKKCQKLFLNYFLLQTYS